MLFPLPRKKSASRTKTLFDLITSRVFWVGAILPLVAIIAIPAHAGFFNELVKLFTNTSLGDRRAAFIQETQAASNAAPVLSAIPNPEVSSTSTPPLNVAQESALLAPTNPLGTVQEQADPTQIFLYTVKPGDTPSSIAKSFNVSVNTIVWANNLKSTSAIQVGDELIILPVSGVKHTVKKGETIESIAKKYRGDPTEILAFNGLPPGTIPDVGMEIIIPDGELGPAEAPATPSATRRFAALPLLKGYFLRPITGGYKSQGIHGNNGVDLSPGGDCYANDFPILAAADGVVLVTRDTGWNGGFGEFTVINHPNGTQTLYAHQKKILVAPGEEVSQGQIIGFVGNTGNTKGVTGCHVHFEVHGARNPF